MQMPLRNSFFHATVAALAMTALTVVMLAQAAHAQYVGREQDITSMRLGQRVLVDDGSCPAGQVKEVSGSKMVANGIMVARKCIPRLGPKKTRN